MQQQIVDLAQEYGHKLVNGQIKDSELKTLFEKLGDNPNLIKGFLSIVGPFIDREYALPLMQQLINLDLDSNPKIFLQKDNLATHFLLFNQKTETDVFTNNAQQYLNGDMSFITNLANNIPMELFAKLEKAFDLDKQAAADLLIQHALNAISQKLEIPESLLFNYVRELYKKEGNDFNANYKDKIAGQIEFLKKIGHDPKKLKAAAKRAEKFAEVIGNNLSIQQQKISELHEKFQNRELYVATELETQSQKINRQINNIAGFEARLEIAQAKLNPKPFSPQKTANKPKEPPSTNPYIPIVETVEPNRSTAISQTGITVSLPTTPTNISVNTVNVDNVENTSPPRQKITFEELLKKRREENKKTRLLEQSDISLKYKYQLSSIKNAIASLYQNLSKGNVNIKTDAEQINKDLESLRSKILADFVAIKNPTEAQKLTFKTLNSTVNELIKANFDLTKNLNVQNTSSPHQSKFGKFVTDVEEQASKVKKSIQSGAKKAIDTVKSNLPSALPIGPKDEKSPTIPPTSSMHNRR